MRNRLKVIVFYPARHFPFGCGVSPIMTYGIAVTYTPAYINIAIYLANSQLIRVLYKIFLCTKFFYSAFI